MDQTLSTTIQPSSDEQAREVRWGDVPAATYAKLLIIGALFYSFFYQEISGLVKMWLNDPSWSHGFLIPLFSLYFIHQKRQEILTIPSKPSYFWGLGGLIFFLVLYVLNIVQFKFGYGRQILMLAALASVVLLMGGFVRFRYLWLPTFFLFFAIPLPAQIYRQLTIPMRKLAATISTLILNLVPNLDAVNQGVVSEVTYRGQPLEPGLDVAEACSGMRLLMAFVALGVAMAYLHDRPIWHRLVLLCSTIPIAIFCNIVRVTITGLIYVLGDPQYAQGIYHDALGILMLPLAFVLYGGLAWIMSNLFTEESSEPEAVIIRRKKDGEEGGDL
jgi:exosortase